MTSLGEDLPVAGGRTRCKRRMSSRDVTNYREHTNYVYYEFKLWL